MTFISNLATEDTAVDMACADLDDRSEDFAKFFYGLIDSHRDQLLFYLDEDALMDWFGRTIVGSKAISYYLKFEAKSTKHNLESVVPTGPIQHRQRMYDGNSAAVGQEIHKKLNGNCPEEDENLSEGMDYLSLKDDFMTPEHAVPDFVPSAPRRAVNKRVRFIEQACGDTLAVLPTVRFPGSTVHFLEAQGNIDLFRPSSSAKGFKRNSDHRACTMKLGYTKSSTKTGTDVRVFIIIYEANNTCKRNLASSFEEMQID